MALNLGLEDISSGHGIGSKTGKMVNALFGGVEMIA